MREATNYGKKNIGVFHIPNRKFYLEGSRCPHALEGRTRHVISMILVVAYYGNYVKFGARFTDFACA
jgi:hypothetical protein